MLENLIKNKKLLFVFALIFSLVFCAELTVIGLEKINSVPSDLREYQKAFPNTFTKLRVDIAYFSLTIIYVTWLLQNNRKQNNFLSFLALLKYAGIFLIIAFLTYPHTTDIYLYLHYGLMGLNGINPYINAANSFTSPLSPFLAWFQTSTYGPISQLFFMSAASTVQVSSVLGVYVFKIFCVLIHGINAYLIWHLLKTSNYRSKITLAYLLNPLLLSEHVASAHVDVFVANALIILIGCLYRRYYIAGFLAIWLGFLEKTLPVIWIPLVLSFLVSKQRWKDLAIAGFFSSIIIIILSNTVLPTIESWKSLVNPGVGGRTAISLHYLLNSSFYLFPHIAIGTKKNILSGFTFLTYLGFASYYLWTLLQSYFRRSYSEANLISDIGWTTLILFLFATPWLMPWYASVILPVTALSTTSPLFVLTSLTFSLSSNLIYGVAGEGVSVFSIIASVTVVGLPIAMLLLGPKLLRRSAQVQLLNNKLPSKLN
jgi:alpha-1,6-mannosyltransferase